MSGDTGFLTTHVLDTATGRPAAGMTVTLYRLDGQGRTQIRAMRTNADGRTDSPILPAAEFAIGTYELEFDVGAYLDAQATDSGTPRFLDLVPIRFGIGEADSHYHVPLLVSPFGYSTYRGS